MIVGHGNEGIITTGAGQAKDPPVNTYISIFNDFDWRPKLQRLAGHFQPLTLLACNPGAGINGAEFLYEVAKAANCTVTAPTGKVWGSGAVEPGSVMQTATPTQLPAPIEPPSPPDSAFLEFKLATESGEFVEFGPDSIIVNKLTLLGTIQSRDARERTVGRSQSERLVSQVAFGEPYQPGGVPLAMLTGYLDVTFKLPGGQNSARRFAIYNDSLLHDLSVPTTFYRTSRLFITELRADL
jgi:hypothetical protein